MGIRFWCPNGHKLHVKAFQAGRVGVCPHCGTKFVIPHKSTRPSSKEAAAQALETAPAGTTDGVLPLGGPPGASPPVASAAPSNAAAKPAGDNRGGGPAAERPAMPLSSPGVTPYGPQASPLPGGTAHAPASAAPAAPVAPAAVEPPAAAGPADAISEAPDSVWYVRPPAGGQFGPATGEVMRSWIDEGRVSADTLVWREGWRDWQEASAVFPSLGTSQGVVPGVASVSATARPIGGGHGGGDRLKARRNAKNIQVVVMVILALAVMVLAGVFVWVLNQASPAPAPPATEAAPDAAAPPPETSTPPPTAPAP